MANLLSRWTPYLDTELHTLSGLVRRGDVCVDVGSGAGLYTHLLSRLVGPTGLVHSVEPVPFFSNPTWPRVLAAHKRHNVRHRNVALGPEPSQAAMRVPYTAQGPDTSRSFLDWDSQGLGSNDQFAYHVDLPVEVDTLDGLAAPLPRLDFVKIDVEGGELHVLQGGQGVIDRFHPTMLIEIESRHTSRYGYRPGDVVAWLTDRGYTMHAWHRGWHEVEHVCAHANNYLFRPSTVDERAAAPACGLRHGALSPNGHVVDAPAAAS